MLEFLNQILLLLMIFCMGWFVTYTASECSRRAAERHHRRRLRQPGTRYDRTTESHP